MRMLNRSINSGRSPASTGTPALTTSDHEGSKMAEAIVSGIYRIENSVNGKFYIGSAVNLSARKSQHFSNLRKLKHKNKRLQNSFNKYGIDAFGFSIVEYVEDKSSLIAREQYWIDTSNPDYNIARTAGSNLGRKFSPETIEKRRLSNAGFKHSEESKLKMSAIQSGRKVSQETREKLSAAIKGKRHSREVREKLSDLALVRMNTQEAKAKVSAYHLGRKHSEEHNRRVSESLKGRKMTQSHKDAIAEALRNNKNAARKREQAIVIPELI